MTDSNIDMWVHENWGQLSQRLNYLSLVNSFVSFFGEEHVKIYTYESLTSDKNSFFDKWSEILNVAKLDPLHGPREKNNSRLRNRASNRRMVLMRLANILPIRRLYQMLPNPIKNLVRKNVDAGPAAADRVSDAVLRMIADHVAEGNEDLDSRYSLGLSSHKYLLPS
jgi:hypothetical protein